MDTHSTEYILEKHFISLLEIKDYVLRIILWW